MGAGGPEARDGHTDRGVVRAGVGIHIASVCDLALGGGVDAVDLCAGEGLETVNAKLVGEGVDARVFEKLLAAVIDGGESRVRFEDALAGELFGEVLAGVEVLEEAADSLDVEVGQLNLTRLGIVNVVCQSCEVVKY